MKRAVLIGVVLVAVAAGAFFFLRSRGGSAPVAAAHATATAERRNLEIVADASGLVEPVRIVEVKSNASGETQRVLVETGDRVEQDALLAEINPRDVQSSLEQAQADLTSARVKAQVTEAHRKRMEELRATAAVTQQEYEQAVDAAASARAGVVRNETAVRLAKERRGDVTLRAPIAGTILTRSVEPGQLIASATANVSGGTVLFTMADLTQMQVRAKIDESDIGRILPGQEARVTVEAHPGRTFLGKVAKVEPQAVVEQNVTLFPVLVRIDNKEGLLRPGMNGEVSIEIASRRDVVAVPSGAVVAAKDAVAAARTLGLQPEQVRAALQREETAMGAATPGGPTPTATTRPPEVAAAAQRPGATGELDDKCRVLADEIRAAGGRDSATDAQRAAMRECYQAAGGRRRGGEAEASGERGKRALVFVQNGATVEPRRVTVGLSDWENTEVVQGLDEGEQVILVSVAQLQKEQQQSSERMRSRMGGVIPGQGGGGPRGGGGGGGRNR